MLSAGPKTAGGCSSGTDPIGEEGGGGEEAVHCFVSCQRRRRIIKRHLALFSVNSEPYDAWNDRELVHQQLRGFISPAQYSLIGTWQ
jgi:hypothetical protein